MLYRKLFFICALILSQGAMAADSNAGKTFFRQQCALCHSAEPGDNGGAQGPLLHGIFGRDAAATEFSYTQAMASSGLTWDADTLDRFLAAPTQVVPGSSMVIPVTNADMRANLITYFEELANGTFQEPAPQISGRGGFRPPPAAAPPPGDPDWINDRPGRVHRVNLDNLPEPYETGSAVNFPQVAERPANAELRVPEGFRVDTFTTDVTGPRAMVMAPNGDIFLSETQNGLIKVMRPSADHSSPEQITVFAQGLLQPLGIAFYPAANPQWVYIAETNRVIRYPYRIGDAVARGVPEVIVPQLSPVGGGHYTRDLAFSPDGTRMFVSVGSQSNVQEDMPVKPTAEIASWEAERGLGAAWGTEENRASVMVFDVSNETASARLWANGIRNCVGLTIQPETGDLWCTVNERDQLGDDLVPDYSTRVPEGSFFGWPWYYMGDNEDPRHAGARPDLVGKIRRPDVPYTAHSAALDLEFYPVSPSGDSAFPAEYAGDGFAVLHGSWNRGHRTGHKIVRLPMEDGAPTGAYVDFMVGFISPEVGPWGRPAAAVIMQDGSMLLSDDGANLIYRISYQD